MFATRQKPYRILLPFCKISCPGGFWCVDDPRDNCDPQKGGIDCGGICVPIFFKKSQFEHFPALRNFACTCDLQHLQATK